MGHETWGHERIRPILTQAHIRCSTHEAAQSGGRRMATQFCVTIFKSWMTRKPALSGFRAPQFPHRMLFI